MVDIKDYLNKEVAPKLKETVYFKGLLSQVAHIKDGAGRELSDILGWDYLVRADNGCYKFYAAQLPLIGMTEPKATKCPLGIQVFDSYEVDIEKVIEILSAVSNDAFVDIALYWPLTPECKEPYWHIRTTSDSYIVIGANSGTVTPSSQPVSETKPILSVEQCILNIPNRKLELVSSPIILKSEEEAGYSQGTVTNGHGSCSGVYVTVQKGTTADVDIDFTIKTVSKEDFSKWKSETQQYFTAEQSHELNEKYGSEGYMGGFLAGAFGMLFAGGDSTHYLNTKDSYQSGSSQECSGFAQKTYNLQTSDFHVKGKLTATGTSFIPVTVSAYVQVTKIVFADGKELHVLSTDDTTVADKSGSTSGAKVSKSDLNITPL